MALDLMCIGTGTKESSSELEKALLKCMGKVKPEVVHIDMESALQKLGQSDQFPAQVNA